MGKISRRDFLKTGAAVTAGTLGPASTVRSLASENPPPNTGDSKRPRNVLILMSDQHTPSALGFKGDAVAHTPNLDQFARTAVSFDQAYCTYPLCLPSRASFLTGLYPQHHQAYTNQTPWPFEHKTLGHYFHDAGFMTSLIGKMHFIDAQTHGFDYYMDFNDWFQYLGPKMKIWADELGQANDGSGLPQIPSLWEKQDPWAGLRVDDDRAGYIAVGRRSRLQEEDHFESFVARESVRFLEQYGKKRPFFLISSFLKPHPPFAPAARFSNMFNPAEMKLPESWGKVDLTTVPRAIRSSIEWPAATPELRHPEEARIRMAMYYAQLAQMDDCAGQVLRALRDLNLEDDTLVLYTSDHGEMLGRHGLWNKYVFYEPSVGVPFLCRVPGLTPQAARCKTPVSLVQGVATLAELCGLPMPSGLDGTSFAANLRDPGRVLDTTVFAAYGIAEKNSGYMVRHANYKYCYYPGDLAELYDLESDPEEMKNLALLPEFKSRVDEMKRRLLEWYTPPSASRS